MKIILILWLLAAPLFGDEQRGGEVIPSSNKQLSIRYLWIDDDLVGEAYIHCAILQRSQELPWSFSARGRAMLFSWSPDARYLLVGVVKPGKDMSLHWLEAHAQHPRERDLDLEAVERRVEAALPERQFERGESVGFAPHHQIDFEHVEWLSDGKCRLRYISQFDLKAGEAILELDLAADTPALKIQKVIPSGPK